MGIVGCPGVTWYDFRPMRASVRDNGHRVIRGEIAQRPVGVAAPLRNIVAMGGVRHSAADRTRVRRVPTKGEAPVVS